MSDMTFETKIDKLDIFCHNSEEIPQEAKVFWDCEFEFRGWGIKAAEPCVTRVEISSIDDLGNTSRRVFEKDAIEVDGDTESIPLCPNNIFYDAVREVCTVEF